jgi:hypothetical protein
VSHLHRLDCIPKDLAARTCQVDHFYNVKVRRPQRPILNYALGANFDPKCKVVPPGGSYPLGVKYSVRPSIILNSRECSPLGVNEGVNIPPRGQISPLGAKFNPRGEVKNGPLKGSFS